MICAKGHSFESTAKVRAFCPECGELTRRFPGAEAEEQSEPAEEQGSKEVATKAGSNSPPDETEDGIQAEPEEPPKAVRLKPKVVKVTAKRRAQPVKKIVKKKQGSKPEVKLRVKTNLEKKIAKEAQHKDTHWEQVCKVGWFG